jgi:hypothetical protein
MATISPGNLLEMQMLSSAWSAESDTGNKSQNLRLPVILMPADIDKHQLEALASPFYTLPSVFPLSGAQIPLSGPWPFIKGLVM